MQVGLGNRDTGLQIDLADKICKALRAVLLLVHYEAAKEVVRIHVDALQTV